MGSIKDEYLDVLQNIEFAVVTTYREHQEMTDYDVERTLDSVLDAYAAEKSGRQPRRVRLSELEQILMERVRATCEWRLGRETLADAPEIDLTPITVEEIIPCLKKILKSVKRWNKLGGKRGYLDFVAQYVK